MYRFAALGAAALTVLAALTQFASAAPDGEEEAVRAVIQLYFDGIIEYDEEKLRRAFHPDAYVIGPARDGTVGWHPFQEWVLYTRGEAPDPTGRHNAILSIDLTGNAAVVKTDLDWPSVNYIDYLSLLKIDGEWRIVNKTWHRADPRPR